MLIPINQQPPHDPSPERRRQRDERHGLITVRQRRSPLMRLQPPKIFRRCHMVIGVTRQVVVQGIRERSIAVPTMMLFHRMIFDEHEAEMLHIVDQLVEQTPEQPGGDDHEYPAGAGEDSGENDNRQGRDVAEDQSVAP